MNLGKGHVGSPIYVCTIIISSVFGTGSKFPFERNMLSIHLVPGVIHVGIHRTVLKYDLHMCTHVHAFACVHGSVYVHCTCRHV